MTEPVTPAAIFQLGMGFWGSKTLLSAVDLDVFTELAAGPLDLDALTLKLGLHERGARDFFDALVALGMLERNGGLYSNTAETGLFLDRNKPTYVGGLLEMANHRLYRFWGGLTEALRTGQPQNEIASGGDLFATMYADPQILEEFLEAMTGVSLGAANAIAAAFPFDRYASFADIGCAQGGLTVAIANAYGHLSATGFDLAPVGPIFEKYVRGFGLSDRVSFQAGNFFCDPLPEADVLIMGHILHDWNLEQKEALVAKAHAALKPGGALIIYDAIIDDDRRENSFGLLMSLNMLIETPGGFDYTGAECIGWLRKAGFTQTRVEPLGGADSMIVGVK
ncbi:methyltransferase [Methylocapsa palsarum]|uniref:Ubiquinone/menaquinone biosynthesis C-methylase UbiE n=1 Tax=Methylocapsa palsarum TaxID=1612308 RepID=A0A1I4ADL7_9HYPH|nr:methyltransferase [Methylocapsa palsarum]SFK54280.1 Ubiquinone/menaquinone biosynthesis C-methylase UbiE [Methylocapsa palsarum]